jgi:recombinational DNA repair ATPase RecF
MRHNKMTAWITANQGRGLLVDRIEINDFRLCKSLQVERFGRVNLIVGKNGVG